MNGRIEESSFDKEKIEEYLTKIVNERKYCHQMPNISYEMNLESQYLRKKIRKEKS